VRALLLCLALAVPASAGGPVAAPAAASFAPVREAFVSRFVAYRPEAATALGMPGLDGKLSIPTQEVVAEQIRFFEHSVRALADLKTQSPQDEIDRQVVLKVARSQLHELRDRKSHLTDVGAAKGPYEIIQLQLVQGGSWSRILERALLTPAYLSAVTKNLSDGAAQGRQVYRGFVEKEGLEGAAAAAAFFRSELLQKAKEQLPAAEFQRLKPALEAAGAQAAAAYDAYAEFLKKTVLPRATETYALGSEEYSWKLLHELGVKDTPGALRVKGEALAAKIAARMEELARQLDPNKPLSEQMAALKADHPADDAALLDYYREASGRARDFVVKEKLFDIPADYSIRLIETPAGMRSHIGSAAYFPAPPLDASRKGVFLVTPSGGDAKRLAIHNHAKIPTTVVHEAFPGHDMQFWTFQRANVPSVRHLLDQAGYAASFNVEGYAHYAEELMRQKGFFTPKEELAQLGAQLWRAWRIVLDSGLHTGTITMAEASRLLVEKAFLPEAIAQVEAYRYAKMPTQALTYALGRLEIEELKSGYEQASGSRYSEAAFHQTFLSFGPVPPSMIGPVMLKAARGSWLRRAWENPGVKVLLSMLLAAAFNVGVYVFAGAQAAQEFLSVYLIEWTLSLDNLVVLSTVLHALPKEVRPKVLGWGILGTIVMRMVMVSAGMGVAAANPGIFVVFGAFLATVAVKMIKPQWDLLGWAVKKTGLGLKKAGARLGFGKSGKPSWLKNPLVYGLLAVIGYDVIFALDSVPAALAISTSVFVIISANIFSVMGLRSLFAVLDKLEEKFRHLHKGVAAVLLFVAAKMILAPLAHIHVGSLASLLVVLGMLGASMLLSLRKPRGA
jgi:TerC family integral membrane protein